MTVKFISRKYSPWKSVSIPHFCDPQAALLGEILRREHKGEQRELVNLRQELSRLHAGLFDTYMATRKLQHR
jgi:hypothetical protein